ncbi:MAG: hypothetical protein JSR27_02145 [Proteobacteria bacterium]|nr:hypothetical protein [Pseudomonadota bacterium]
MKAKTKRAATVVGSLLLAVLGTLPVTGFAVEHDSDDATARRQAMYEWYTDDYSHHGEEGFTNQKQLYFAPEFERFLNDIARQERSRFAALLPGTAQRTNSPSAALAAGSWTNIGPNNANFAQNGGTLYVTDSGRANVILTDPNNANTIYIGFSGGGVWKSTDGGSTWVPKTETLGSLSVGSLAMDPSNSNTLYLGLGDPFDGTGIGLVKSTDGGDTWSNPVYLGNSTVIANIEIARSSPQIVLAATNAGLYRSTDGGTSFSKVTIATGQSADPYVWTLAWGGSNTFVLGLEAAYANMGTGSSTLGQIWRSTDNGATWTQSSGVTNLNGATDNGVGRMYIAAAPSNRNIMYAEAANMNEGSSGTDFADIFKSTDNGVTWTGMGKTAVNGSTYKSYTNTNSESKNLSTLLNGQGWYNLLVLIDANDPNVAYFGGALLLVRTNDGGTSYRQVSNWLAQFSLPYVHADFHGGTTTSAGTLYVGTDGGIFRSTDAATSAASNTTPTFTDTLNKGIASHLVYQVGSSTNNTSSVVVGLQDNGTRVRVGSTSTFNQIIGGDGFGCDVNQGDATKMLGSLYYSRVYRSTNSGTSFASACSGITECNNSSTAPFKTVLSRWAGDSTGNTVFTFSNTKIYKTTNYATSWTALGTSGLPTSSLYIRGVGAAKSSANTVGAVTNGGRAYLTSNGGTSWTQIGNANASGAGSLPGNGASLSWITFDPTNANIIYIASVAPSLTASHIWRTTNSGTSWAAIDGAATGFPSGVPVNAVFVDPSTPTTLYAATQLGVYFSEDSGGSWTRYGADMPLVNVTDLYLASDGSLTRAATFGRSVWQYAQSSAQYTVGGNVSGATSAVGLTLADTTNSTTQVQSYGNGGFTFPTGLNAGDNWNVVVSTPPAGQTCTVANGSGTSIGANVSNVNVTCKTNQTITFTSTAPAAAVVGGATYTITATASSGLAVVLSIDSSSSAVCGLSGSTSGSTVSFTGVGTCTIDANQAGNGTYNVAPQAQQSFTVGKGSQSISFTSTAPTGAVVGGTTYAVTATSSAGLTPVTFAIDASASSVCTISGNTVSFIGAGTCLINANQTGNANYAAAPQAQQSFAVGKANQTITFPNPGAQTYSPSGSFAVSATASSNLAVTFTSATSSVCTVSGTTVTILAAGTCTINADQSGNANYNAAPTVSDTITINPASQTITFTSTPPGGATVNGTYNVTATGGASGNPVTFSIDAASNAVCTISGSLVTFTGAGNCLIYANQAGNANYAAATQAQQVVAVGLQSQTITFPNPGPVTYSLNGTFALTATGGASGNPVTYASNSTGVCTVSGSAATIVSAGTCSITASQSGNSTYGAASPVTDLIAINPAGQSISFTSTPPTSPAIGGTYAVSATGGASGNAVTFSIDAASAAGACSISGNTVSFTGTGTCLIDADQAGNANYTAATRAQQTLTVGLGTLSLVFTTQPVDIARGTTQGTLAVTEQNQFGYVISSDSSSTVNFSVVACGGPVSLGSATMSNGVATLSSSAQRFYSTATGVTVGADSSGIGSATSNAFNVIANSDVLFSDGFDGCRL